MAGFDYISAQKTADRLIKQFGFQMPILKPASSFDPVLGKNLITSLQVSTNHVVSLPATSASVNGFDNTFNEEVKKGKIRFIYISAKELSFDLEAGDLVIFENKIWHVAGATPLNPAGVPLYFTAGIKSGGADVQASLAGEMLTEYNSILTSLASNAVPNSAMNTLLGNFFETLITETDGDIFA